MRKSIFVVLLVMGCANAPTSSVGSGLRSCDPADGPCGGGGSGGGNVTPTLNAGASSPTSIVVSWSLGGTAPRTLTRTLVADFACGPVPPGTQVTLGTFSASADPGQLVDTAVTAHAQWLYTLSAGTTQLSAAVDTPPSARPDNPLTITSVGKHDMSVLWRDEFADESIVKLQIAPSSDGPWSDSCDAQAGSAGVTCQFHQGGVSGLGANTGYCLRLAIVGALATQYSDPLCAVTNPLQLPVTPSNVRITAKTQSSLSVAWDDPYSDHTGFKVQLEGWSYPVVDAGTHQYTFTGLQSGSRYCISVKAVGGIDGDSDSSPSVCDWTLGSAPTSCPGNANGQPIEFYWCETCPDYPYAIDVTNYACTKDQSLQLAKSAGSNCTFVDGKCP